MSYAAQVMRSVVVDDARRNGSDRRGGGTVHVELDDEAHEVAVAESHECPLRCVQESLEQLSAVDARVARVVELRYFTGLSEVEIAGALGIAVRTVSCDWGKAKAFLQTCLG